MRQPHVRSFGWGEGTQASPTRWLRYRLVRACLSGSRTTCPEPVALPSGTPRDTRTGNKYMANKIVEKMWEWSDGGKIPVVCDASSCTFGITTEILSYLTLQNSETPQAVEVDRFRRLAYDYLLPKLKVERQVESAIIHPVCSIHHLVWWRRCSCSGRRSRRRP